MVVPGAAASGGGVIAGVVLDQTGSLLPGVTIELRDPAGELIRESVTNDQGVFRFDGVAGAFVIEASYPSFSRLRRSGVRVDGGASVNLQLTLTLSLAADVVVTAKRSFDLRDMDGNDHLIGVAHSATQGVVSGRQLELRPILRAGEVLEAVPGVIISQHSGEGKANQYYLRGFNLDHGTDFATTVAGVPVNMPTHAHGHGYSDLNFLIPELVSGVQFNKGPYAADEGDFSTAGASHIRYVNALDRAQARATFGGDGYRRLFAAASPRIGGGQLLSAIEVGTNDGPWARPDDYSKINGVVRFSRGSPVQAFSATAMGYSASWNATDQIPLRA
ncbi:MAG TPA: TonB-dependent receptor, partial [Vicinamibacterales bacterium]|nr:TonB-dependent receptor [Vicinamibacterales bacterium]